MAEGRISDLLSAAVDATIGALEEGSTTTPAVRDSRRATIGGVRIASTPAPETPARLMHPDGMSRVEYITMTKADILELRANGLAEEADELAATLTRYLRSGSGSGSAGAGSSATAPPTVPADKYAGSDLKDAFQKAVSNKNDVTALKGTIGLNSTPHSVRVAVMTILQHLANVQDGPLISAIIHQALLLDPIRCIASDASLPVGARRPWREAEDLLARAAGAARGFEECDAPSASDFHRHLYSVRTAYTNLVSSGGKGCVELASLRRVDLWLQQEFRNLLAASWTQALSGLAHSQDFVALVLAVLRRLRFDDAAQLNASSAALEQSAIIPVEPGVTYPIADYLQRLLAVLSHRLDEHDRVHSNPVVHQLERCTVQLPKGSTQELDTAVQAAVRHIRKSVKESGGTRDEVEQIIREEIRHYRHSEYAGDLQNPKSSSGRAVEDGAAYYAGGSKGGAGGNGSGKGDEQTRPCFYFQKGACVHGAACKFLHAPEAAASRRSAAACSGHLHSVREDRTM